MKISRDFLLLETLQTTVEPSATEASSVSVKTAGMSLIEINNAVILTIQDTDLSEVG